MIFIGSRVYRRGGRADTIDEDKLRAIKAGGVNRISINPQTMDDNVLRAAGRSHTTEQVEKAFEIARQVGFDVINADLIAGLPTDTPEGFRRSLGRLLSLRPENVTVHTLALKKGSKLSEGGFLPSEEDGGRCSKQAKASARSGLRPITSAAGNFETSAGAGHREPL